MCVVSKCASKNLSLSSITALPVFITFVSATHGIAIIYPLTFNHTAKKINEGNNNKNVISAPIPPPRMYTAINQNRLILYCSLTRISARQIDTHHNVLRASLMNEILVDRGVDARSLPNQEVPKSGRNSEGIYRDGERRSRKKEEIKGCVGRNKHAGRVSSCIMDRVFILFYQHGNQQWVFLILLVWPLE